MSDENNSKLKDMDEYLKIKLVDLWFEAIALSIVGDYKKVFRAYKMLFKMIEPYSFSDKVFLQEVTALLEEYIGSLGARPVNTSESFLINNSKQEFKALLDRYTSILPKAFVDLNLWFKAIPSSNDIDLKMSDENFNSDLTFISQKRKALLKLDSDKLLELFSVNAIHDAHAKGLMSNVL